MDTYKDQFTPADLDAAEALYSMLMMFEGTRDYEAIASYIDWVRSQEPDLYADLLILDMMKAGFYGRKAQS